MGCIDYHRHDVTYLSDYTIILRSTQSLNPRKEKKRKKKRTRMHWLVLYCWASPASVELICSAGEPFQRVSGHTHRFVPPLAIPLTDKPHTLLQFTRSSSHRPSVNMGIACSALHNIVSSIVYGNAYDKIDNMFNQKATETIRVILAVA